MKSKVNIPSRGKSNPPLKNLPPSSLLEEQTRKMEQQLKELKDVMAQKAMSRDTTSESQDGSRWQSANPNLPIRNYPKAVLESKGKGTLGSTSSSKGSTLTFTSKPREKVPREKLSSREKLAPIPGVTSSTPSNTSFKNKENESQKGFFQDTFSNEATSQTSLPTPVKSTPKQQKPSVSQADVDRSAENNLKKALKIQKEETDDEVTSFLQEIGLPQYIQVFKDNGFDDLETVMEIQTKHLVDMKIPAGHQIKLTKRIENLRANDPNRSIRNTLPTPTQKSTSQATTNNGGVNVQQIKSNAESYYGAKTNEYVQLAEPTREMAIGDDRKGGGELLGGTFNEAESHQSFLEALNEWRTGKAKPVEAEKTAVPRAKESRSKKVRFAEAVPEKEEKEDDVDYISTKPKASASSKPKEEKKEEAPKSFLFSGGSAWNQVEVPGQQEHGTGMSPRSQPQVKVSCWNCYRLIPENEIISIGEKQVCSEQCAKTYREVNSTKCTKKGCSNAFLKEDGLLIEGKWYCSEKCAPTAEELLMEEQRMLKRLQNEEGYSASNRDIDDQEPEEQEQEGEDDDVEAFELSVDMSNKKEVLTLAELEEKYKNMSKMAQKAQDNEFEDSLN